MNREHSFARRRPAVIAATDATIMALALVVLVSAVMAWQWPGELPALFHQLPWMFVVVWIANFWWSVFALRRLYRNPYLRASFRRRLMWGVIGSLGVATAVWVVFLAIFSGAFSYGVVAVVAGAPATFMMFYRYAAYRDVRPVGPDGRRMILLRVPD